MPAKSPKQYGLMAKAMTGGVSGISPAVGREFVEKTPKAKRKAFSKALMKKKKKGMDGMEEKKEKKW
jgi:L-serine deaminase